MKKNHISLEHAKQNKLFYFVPTVVVYRHTDGRCLLLKRHEREVVAPGKWSIPGGKLEWQDLDQPVVRHAIERLLAREVLEESGLSIEPDLTYLDSLTFIRSDGIPVITPIFAAVYKSGEVILEAHSFTEYAWVNETEVQSYDCIGGVPDEIEKAITCFQKT